jgi:hypothetical protein
MHVFHKTKSLPQGDRNKQLMGIQAEKLESKSSVLLNIIFGLMKSQQLGLMW